MLRPFRSYKEAQSYLGMLAPMVPGIVATIYPLSNHPWLAVVPILGQFALAADLLGGQQPGAGFYAIAGVAALAVASALVFFSARLLNGSGQV